MKVIPAAAAILLAPVLLCGAVCNRVEFPPVNSTLLNPSGNFTLYVSNQSFAISPVDIKVQIDGEVVVHQNFDVGTQHNWKKFGIALPPGVHSLTATSTKGDATLEQEFTVTGEHWAVVDYWYYPEVTGGAGPTPRTLSFSIQDSPIGFM
ncbi:MAG: hypothetical protein KJ060_05720 [Candidatus Hydrogenedentes bacterium]|nr:hypothetical protein [Candidatus Hydrogenedentota bacterium]